MRRSIDDHPAGAADVPPGLEDDLAPVSWAVAISDDYDDAEPRVVLTVEEVGRAGEGLVAQVRRGMRALVLTPDCTLDAAARLSGMHGRTLNRRLSALGTSFFELREEARREVACQTHTAGPLNDVERRCDQDVATESEDHR